MHIALYFLTIIALYARTLFTHYSIEVKKPAIYWTEKCSSLRKTKTVYDKCVIYFRELMVAANV